MLTKLTTVLLLTSLIAASPTPQDLISSILDPIIGLTADAPAALKTNEKSDQCLAVNNGELLCCAEVINGGNELVVEAGKLLGVEIPGNAINGLACEFFFRERMIGIGGDELVANSWDV